MDQRKLVKEQDQLVSDTFELISDTNCSRLEKGSLSYLAEVISQYRMCSF